MKKIALIIGMILCAACVKDEVPYNPFTYIQDENQQAASVISSAANNYSTTLRINTSSKLMDHDVQVHYKVTVGGGLKEGVDFRMKQALEGTLTFAPGVYSQPLHFVWFRNTVDSSKDNTVTVEITGCSEDDFVIGYLSLTDTHLYDKYVYTKRNPE